MEVEGDAVERVGQVKRKEASTDTRGPRRKSSRLTAKSRFPEFGRDPELATALRLSMEEERVRQERSIAVEKSTVLTKTEKEEDHLGALIWSSSQTAKSFLAQQNEPQHTYRESSVTGRKSSRLANNRADTNGSVEGDSCNSIISVVCRRAKRAAKKCSALGCTNNVKKGGVCYRHGAIRPKYICSAPGCTNVVVNNGVCISHGAEPQKRKKCSTQGCTNLIKNNGVCARHGAEQKKCSMPDCTNIALKGGVCHRHGTRKKCSTPDCTNVVVNNGVCVRHGAKLKKCSAPGCTNIVVSNGVCCRHGAKWKKRTCSAPDCTNIVVNNGVCWRHGAKRKKCSTPGCTNNVVNKGVCCRHGAKQARSGRPAL